MVIDDGSRHVSKECKGSIEQKWNDDETKNMLEFGSHASLRDACDPFVSYPVRISTEYSYFDKSGQHQVCF